MEAIRADVARLSTVPRADELAYAIERLFATATALEEHLDERFG